jgi:hypothetical protein
MGKKTTANAHLNASDSPKYRHNAYNPYPTERVSCRVKPTTIPNGSFQKAIDDILTCPIRTKSTIPKKKTDVESLFPQPNCPQFVTPADPDPIITTFPVLIDLLAARPHFPDTFEYRDVPEDLPSRFLSFSTPPDLPKVISYRIDSWKPPRNGFPPWIQFINCHPNWNDCDVHTALFLLENESHSPSLFARTVVEIFSVPGLSNYLAALDLREGFSSGTDWLVNKSAGHKCLISSDWGLFRHRRLLRFLMNVL